MLNKIVSLLLNYIIRYAVKHRIEFSRIQSVEIRNSFSRMNLQCMNDIDDPAET
jgi:ABC-type uncharacterized transport system permease subunit